MKTTQALIPVTVTATQSAEPSAKAYMVWTQVQEGNRTRLIARWTTQD